jgi:hypothetical protein
VGFSPSGVSPLKKPRRLISQRTALLASSPPATGRHGIPGRGRSNRASRIRVGALIRLQGFELPESPSASGVRVYVHRASIPSWASASLRCSPCPRMERISPLLRSRALPHQTPGVAPRCPARRRPSVFLPEHGGVVSLKTAWPLRGFTPPSFELLRNARSPGLLIRLELQVASPPLASPPWTVATSRPEWNQNSGSAQPPVPMCFRKQVRNVM